MSHPQLPPGDNNGHLPAPVTPVVDVHGPRPPYHLAYPEQEIAEDPESGGLIEYWRILRRRKGTLLLIAFCGALAGLLFTLPQTPVYQARTSVELQRLNEDFMNMRDVNPNSPSGNYNQDSDIQTQVKIFQSESLLNRVIDKLKLDRRPLVVNESRVAAWRKALNLPEPQHADSREEMLKAISKKIKVRAQANTRLIEILVDSTDPRLASDFANTLTAEFTEQNLEARWKTTQATGEWLTRQMEDLKIKLEKSEDAMQNYARTAGLLFTGEKDNVADQKLKQIQEELSRAQAERVSMQSRYEVASTSQPDTLAQVLDNAALKDQQEKLTDLRRQLAELMSSLTPVHPKVKRVQAQIVTLESATERERGKILQRIGNDFHAAQRREKLLASAYGSQARLLTDQADKVSHYNILKREVDTNRQLYDSMLQRVREAGISSALRASNVRIVDPATPPERPYKPNLPLNSALGLLAGGFLGVAFVVMRERANRSIQDPGDTPFFLNCSELGIIPSLSSDPLLKHHAVRLRIKPSEPKSQSLTLLEETPKPPASPNDPLALVTWQRKPSAIAESFRAVLTSILFCGSNGDRPRVIVLSSANPKEGKSTVTSNLSIAIAEINRRVVLIDADLRKPRMHTIFGLENETGLSDLLQHPEPLTAGALQPFLRESGIPNLLVLTSGPATDAAANLLHSPRMAEIISLLRDEHDMVLIDTPPMLAMPDARVIGRLADGVILVLRAHQTTRDAIMAATSRFKEDGILVLGTILNDWNPKLSTGAGYGYGYYKYHDHYKHYYAKK